MQVDTSDLLALVVGALFAAIGGSAGAMALSARPRVDRTAGWFAVFCIMYGVRLVARAEPVRAAVGWPDTAFEHIDATITYTILVPASLFVESLVGRSGDTILRLTWQLLLACAIGASVAEMFTGRPYAAIAINTPLVVIAVIVWFAHFAMFGRKGRWSPPLRGVVIAAALLGFSAVYETIMNRGLLGRLDAEPLAMLVFSGALGWFVLVRAREQESGYAALSRELEMARTIQLSLLPQRMPEVPGLRFNGAYLPMSAVAGDFYEILQLAGTRTLVVIADVSGHGMPAALIASMVKIAVAAAADRYDTPGDILTGINRALTGKFQQAYVTACCVVVDSSQPQLHYALAGHPAPLITRADGVIEALDRGGIVLTFSAATVYATFAARFERGDRLLMYTDGLTEAPRPDREEFFGEAELPRVLASTPPSVDLLDAVLTSHQRWIGEGAPLSDDVSLVLVERQ